MALIAIMIVHYKTYNLKVCPSLTDTIYVVMNGYYIHSLRLSTLTVHGLMQYSTSLVIVSMCTVHY